MTTGAVSIPIGTQSSADNTWVAVIDTGVQFGAASAGLGGARPAAATQSSTQSDNMDDVSPFSEYNCPSLADWGKCGQPFLSKAVSAVCPPHGCCYASCYRKVGRKLL